jgi:hypothetical protein
MRWSPNERLSGFRSYNDNRLEEGRNVIVKKPINNSILPDHEIERIARCFYPDIVAFFESEEGQREFEEWRACQSSDPPPASKDHN